MFTTSATINYRHDSDGSWITAWMDNNILNYYYSLIPKHYRVNKPRWKAHATIARPEEGPFNMGVWGMHEGKLAQIVYDPMLHEERGIWWINLWSVEFEQIRLEMNLSIKSRITKPPSSEFSKCFHCTVGMNF